MDSFRNTAKVLIAVCGLAVAILPAWAEDSHTDGGHTDGGHSDGHGGKGKGPKYMGGHSSQVHKGGSHHHDGTSGGSKSTEDKIFHGHESDSGHDEDGGTEHSHT